MRSDLEAGGYAVFVENQNSFALRGGVATLGGKPDLIAIKDGNGLILDVKTGNASPAHHVQVMTYMYAVPKVLQQYAGMAFDGRVVYQDHGETVPGSAITQSFVDNLGALIQCLASQTPARKVPSPVECGFCNISKADCTERSAEDVMAEGATEDF